MAHFIGQLFSLVSNFFSADCAKRRGGANRVGDEVFCDPSAALAFSLRGAIAGHNRCSAVAGCGFWVLRRAFFIVCRQQTIVWRQQIIVWSEQTIVWWQQTKKVQGLIVRFWSKVCVYCLRKVILIVATCFCVN